MARVIAFANQKGGVGKTTSAVNIAASLGLLGKRVLLVDSDPQGNSTSGVGISKKGLPLTLFDVLCSGSAAKDVILATNFSNLSVLPATISLAGAEFELIDIERRESVLKERLAPVLDDFDYIIIDCPPSLGMLTINALNAANSVLIPMQCEYYALEGLSQLVLTIRRIKQLYNPNLDILGILITMYNGRLNLSTQVLSEIKRFYADKLFRTPIARNVRLSEAPSFGMPAYYHDRCSKGAESYLEAAREVLDRCGDFSAATVR